MADTGLMNSERLRNGAHDAAEFLRNSGNPVDHQIVPDMGHFYPDDLESLRTAALSWIESGTAD